MTIGTVTEMTNRTHDILFNIGLESMCSILLQHVARKVFLSDTLIILHYESLTEVQKLNFSQPSHCVWFFSVDL
jgi:hypothetical protein